MDASHFHDGILKRRKFEKAISGVVFGIPNTSLRQTVKVSLMQLIEAILVTLFLKDETEKSVLFIRYTLSGYVSITRAQKHPPIPVSDVKENCFITRKTKKCAEWRRVLSH